MRQFCADSHYPDSFEPFPAERVGPETIGYRTLKSEMLDKRLSEYLAAGGKAVWVGGGKPLGSLCKGLPKEFMAKGADTTWPIAIADFRAGTLGAARGAARHLIRSPEGKAGWHWPSGSYVFSPEAVAGMRVVLTWLGVGEAKVVGAAWPKERPSVAYLPTYAVSPYLWTQETPELFPLRLELDAAGVEAVEAALEAVM